MNKTLILILTLLLILSGIVLAASTSANYKLVTEAVSVGTGTISSAHYSIRSIARQRQVSSIGSTTYSVGEGFLRSAYFAAVVFAPIVTSVTPGTGINNASVDVVIAGANFTSGAAVKLSKSGQTDIPATSVQVVSTSKITCTFNLSGAAAGLWDVTVTGSDGRAGTLPSAFTIGYPAPTVTSVAPEKGNNNETAVALAVTGTYFRSGASVKLAKTGETDIIAEGITVGAADKITCKVNLSNKTVGQWDVTVTNDDSQAGTLSLAFKVEAPVLAITGPIELSQPLSSPNSTVKATAFKYNLTKDSDIVVNIYTMRGEKIWSKTIPSGEEGGKVGSNQIIWDSITAFKAKAGIGVYFLYVTAKVDGQVKTLQKVKFGIVQ